MRKFKNQKGFTLIELIVVIAILSILVLIVIPLFSEFNERARIAADQANVRILNSVTVFYRIVKDSKPDPFLDDTIDSITLLDKLVSEELLTAVPQTQSKGNEFFWSIPYETWVLSDIEGNIYYFTFNGTGGIAFEDFSSFVPRWSNRDWEITAGGLRSTYTTSGWDTENILYIPAEDIDRNYDISVNAAMNNGPGYGILFDTAGQNNEENGYSLQYERTSSGGRIIIRPRINGRENPTIEDFGGASNFENHYLYNALSESERQGLYNGNRVSPILYTYTLNDNQINKLEAGNQLLLEVRDSDDRRRLNVYLGDERVINNFEYSVEDMNQPMKTSGLRVWNHNNFDGENVLFNSFNISSASE